MKTYLVTLLMCFALSRIVLGQKISENQPVSEKQPAAGKSPIDEKHHKIHHGKNLAEHLPEKIKAHMKVNYPDVDMKKMSWHKNLSHNYNDVLYQASFDNKGLMVTIELIHDGTVHAKETELKKQDVPKSLEFFLQGHVINYIAYIEYHDEAPVYVVESSYKKYKFLRAYTPNGALITGDKWFSLIGYKPS